LKDLPRKAVVNVICQLIDAGALGVRRESAQCYG
jgi:hypothetical protein